MADAKYNASLFDKLTANDRIRNIVDDGRSEVIGGSGKTELRLGSASRPDRLNEAAMRAGVRRELNWLLNSVNLAAAVDLTRYPQVQTSVLNYGMADLTGRVSTPGAINARANDIRQAIRTFEPRMDGDKLRVEAQKGVGLDNSVSFIIRGDITSAVKAMPVQFLANVEIETGEAVVRE
jgi:type VI secretion system protein ImpF